MHVVEMHNFQQTHNVHTFPDLANILFTFNKQVQGAMESLIKEITEWRLTMTNKKIMAKHHAAAFFVGSPPRCLKEHFGIWNESLSG